MRGSSVTEHTVPPFYACYLLKSQRRPNVTYVGSTPDPERRLRQHNGSISQGAFTTRFSRPWQMDLLVCGFPSRIAALQFEWSWQHPNMSRHLRQMDQDHDRFEDETRAMTPLFPADRHAASTSRSGSRKNIQRVSGVPEQRMLVMRALLASEPFCFWDLHVVFFNEWAYGVWLHLERNSPRPLFRRGRNTDRHTFQTHPRISCDFRGVAGASIPLELSSEWPQLPEAQTLSAWQKRQQSPRTREVVESEPDGWKELMPVARDAQTLGLRSKDISEAPTLKQALTSKPKKASPLLGDDNSCTALEQSLIENKTNASLAKAKNLFLQESHRCGLCKEEIHANDTLSYSMCPSRDQSCKGMFHIECLAKHNLNKSPDSREFCLPVSSECPSCNGISRPWPEIVRRVFRRAEILS